MNAQMKKGILELIVLNEIEQGDIYGYELVKKLCEYYVDVDISSYYTILRRLHGKAYIECYEGDVSGGPKRKYYSITEIYLHCTFEASDNRAQCPRLLKPQIHI